MIRAGQAGYWKVYLKKKKKKEKKKEMNWEITSN